MRGTVLLYVLVTVYILAVNYYGFRLVRSQYEEGGTEDKLRGEAVRMLLTAALGGALAQFITMLVLRFRLKNLVLMIALPLFIVLNGYCFSSSFKRSRVSSYEGMRGSQFSGLKLASSHLATPSSSQ